MPISVRVPLSDRGYRRRRTPDDADETGRPALKSTTLVLEWLGADARTMMRIAVTALVVHPEQTDLVAPVARL